MIAPALRRFRADERGVTVVEFALIAMPMCFTLLGLLDLGYSQYMSAQLNGAVHAAVRAATVGNLSTDQVDSIVYQMAAPFAKRSEISIQHLTYQQMSAVGKAETLTLDANGNGRYDPGDCWIDSNPNGVWDSDAGLNTTLGSDQVVHYLVSVTYTRFLPLGRWLGWGNTQTITAGTVMRNQPYAGHPAPAEVCG